jgi:hypothetical protein
VTVRDLFQRRRHRISRSPGAPLIRSGARTAAFALTEDKEHPNMKPKNTICLWFNKDAHEAARRG